MGSSSETDKSNKDPKTPIPPPSSTQASAASTGTVNPEWSGFQAYSPMPPHGYMASSPQGPYMWGVQHVMPPYGTPSHPYMAMYPPGVYAHPSMPPGSYPYNPYAVPPANAMPEASGNTPGGVDVDGRPPEGKEKLPIKRAKGSLGSLNMVTGKKVEQGKAKEPLANGAYSKSAESASGGSSEGSDTNSLSDSQVKSGGRQESLEASHSGNSMHSPQNGVPVTMVNPMMGIVPMPPVTGALAGPATNLNIGMDYWGGAAPPPAMPIHGKVSASTIPTGIVTPGSRDNLQPQLWLQDDREVKREKRKQSNRESARRSRLRKQAECDELAQRADVLNGENTNIRSEINRIKKEVELLIEDNKRLKKRLAEASEDPANKKRPTGQKEQAETGH